MFVCCLVITDVAKCLCVVLLSQMSDVKLLYVVVLLSQCYMLNAYVCCPVISDVTC